MKDLSIEQLCQGIFCAIDNALNLLNESKILRSGGHTARAYALAYMACEEFGKVSILAGAATKLAIKRPVDWKSVAKRFRSHESKAMQFNGLDAAIPIILEAVAQKKTSVDLDTIQRAAATAMLEKKTSLKDRNSALYCDYDAGQFVNPKNIVSNQAADILIGVAERQLDVARKVFDTTAEDAANMIRARANPQRYDTITNVDQILSQVYETGSAAPQVKKPKTPSNSKS
jgi:AbiV family abortive infection protein